MWKRGGKTGNKSCPRRVTTLKLRLVTYFSIGIWKLDIRVKLILQFNGNEYYVIVKLWWFAHNLIYLPIKNSKQVGYSHEIKINGFDFCEENISVIQYGFLRIQVFGVISQYLALFFSNNTGLIFLHLNQICLLQFYGKS